MTGRSLSAAFRKVINWQRIPANSIQFKSQEKELSFLITYAVFYIISGFFIGLAIKHYPIPILGTTDFITDVWYSIIFKIILLLVVPAVVYFGWWRYTMKDLLLGLSANSKNITATVLLFSAGFLLNSGHMQSIRESFGNFTDSPARLVVGIIMPLFIAAIPEEFFFRGFLQTRLEKKWNRTTAILVSTLLFAAWHLPSRYLLANGAEGQAGDWGQVLLLTGIPVFIVGVIFAIHWSRYRNIVLLVLTHWAIDILPSVSSYFKIPT